ncbi:MAG: hypothetical protein K2X81_18130 [Candidatus Obscuribacterales bacterium]|nr:hypothetical protein [Candidatus Obscuribacterales bacterium]
MRSYYQLSLIALSLVSLWQPAFAQNWGQAAKPAETKEARMKRQKAQFKTTVIDRPVTIPNMPQYPAQRGGMKLMRAFKYSSLGQGNNCIVQTFSLKDPPDMVRDWYAGALAQYGWSVQPANQRNTQLLGRRIKDGSSVHIMISPSTDKVNSKTVVQIRYMQFPPLGDD